MALMKNMNTFQKKINDYLIYKEEKEKKNKKHYEKKRTRKRKDN